MILLDSGASYDEFRKGFPLVMAYIDRRYRVAGTREFDGRYGLTLFVARGLEPGGTFDPLGWPCVAAAGEAHR